MFSKSKSSGKGTVLITCKKVTPQAPKGATAAVKAAKQPPHCLFRATLGGKKISTTVDNKEVNKFHTAYVTPPLINFVFFGSSRTLMGCTDPP